MPLAEDNSIKWSRELKRDDHPCLLAGHVQPRDLRHVAGLLPLLAEGLNLSMGNLGRVEEFYPAGCELAKRYLPVSSVGGEGGRCGVSWSCV